MFSNGNQEELEVLKRSGELESDLLQVRLQKKSGKKDFHYDAKEHFGSIRKVVTDASEESASENKPNTKANEKLIQPIELF